MLTDGGAAAAPALASYAAVLTDGGAAAAVASASCAAVLTDGGAAAALAFASYAAMLTDGGAATALASASSAAMLTDEGAAAFSASPFFAVVWALFVDPRHPQVGWARCSHAQRWPVLSSPSCADGAGVVVKRRRLRGGWLLPLPLQRCDNRRTGPGRSLS
jgi:hypothetical protein